MDFNNPNLFAFIFGAVIVIVIILLLREVSTWYIKTSNIVTELKKINLELQKTNQIMQDHLDVTYEEEVDD